MTQVAANDPDGFVRHARGYVRQPTPYGETLGVLNITAQMIAEATPNSPARRE